MMSLEHSAFQQQVSAALAQQADSTAAAIARIDQSLAQLTTQVAQLTARPLAERTTSATAPPMGTCKEAVLLTAIRSSMWVWEAASADALRAALDCSDMSKWRKPTHVLIVQTASAAALLRDLDNDHPSLLVYYGAFYHMVSDDSMLSYLTDRGYDYIQLSP